MAQTEPTATRRPIRIRGRSAAPDKSVPQVVSELWTLTVDYAKQEIKDPLRNLGSFIAWGIVSMSLIGIGLVLLALGMLRALQTETGSAFTGSLSFLPYVFVLLAAVAALAIGYLLIIKLKRGSGGKHLRED